MIIKSTEDIEKLIANKKIADEDVFQEIDQNIEYCKTYIPGIIKFVAQNLRCELLDRMVRAYGINLSDLCYSDCIFVAAQQEHSTNMVHLLIEHGVDFTKANCLSSTSESLLDISIIHGDSALSAILLQKKHPVVLSEKDVLAFAIRLKQEEAVELLVTQHKMTISNSHIKNAIKKQLETAKLLIEKANHNISESIIDEFLCLAMKYKSSLEFIKYLVEERGASVFSEHNHHSLLFYAHSCSRDVVEYLLEQNIHISQEDLAEFYKHRNKNQNYNIIKEKHEANIKTILKREQEDKIYFESVYCLDEDTPIPGAKRMKVTDSYQENVGDLLQIMGFKEQGSSTVYSGNLEFIGFCPAIETGEYIEYAGINSK